MADLGAYQVDVRFSDSDAQTLISACNNAATAIDGQAGSRRSWRSTGEEQFKGYFSTLFRSNGATQVKDASELSSALRQVAKMTGDLQKAADAEQQRRVKARKWEEQQKHRSIFSKTVGDVSHLWGGDEAPVPPPASQLHQSAPQPPAGKRQTPQPGSGGGASGGTSSAVPDNLTSFATSTGAGDRTLATHQTAVQKAYSAFTSSCGWGSLDAAGVLTGFQQFLEGNAQEVKWANTIAHAFEQAGGSGSVCTLSNQALGAALKSAHVSATRTDLKIDMPSVTGGVPTSGFANDPINTATGNFMEPEVDLSFSDAAGTLLFSRAYNSISDVVGGFGPGWASWSESRLVLADAEARWVHPDGRHVVFPREGEGWARATGASYWLVRGAGVLRITDNSGGRWEFTEAGRLEYFDRGAGTRVDVMYQADGRFVGLVHERGRSVTVDWADDRISRTTASDGRTLDYHYDDRGRLVEAAGPLGSRRYVWGEQSGLIEQVVDGDGVVEALNGYDEFGRVTWQRSPFGRVTRFTYLPGGVTEVADTDGERANTWIADGAGRLIGAIDSDGYRQSYSWDAHGNMVAATDRVGRRTVREHDERGRLVHEVTPTGADLQYGYDELDRVVTVVVGAVDSSGMDAVTTYEYEGDGRNPSVLIDPAGGRSTMAWERGLLVEAADPTGVRVRFGYDAHGELTSVTNALGNAARLERDDAGRVTAAITPSGHRTSYGYDDAGLLVSRRDANDAVWRFEHTVAGRSSAHIAPDGARTLIGYDASGEEVRTVDPLGRVITRVLDDLGNLSQIQLPDGSSWSYTHDALSRLVKTVDPTGGVWSNRYDPDGELTATVDPTGVTRRVSTDRVNNAVTEDDGLMATTLTLDALGRPRGVASSGDDERTYVYDARGRVVEVLDPEGALTLIRRDAAGRPVEIVDPTGSVTGYAYDSCGRLDRVTNPDGGVTTREYNVDSQLVRQVLPNGDVAWAKYDVCGRLTQLHQPGAGTASYSYDSCGRVTSASDLWWGIRRFSYDLAGQLTSVTNGLGGVTSYEYDANGRLARITDPLGQSVRRVWDAMGRLVSEVDPLGRVTRAGYDAAGRQTWQESPDGHRYEFTHDESGRDATASIDGVLVASVARDLAGRTMTTQDHSGQSPVTHVQEWNRNGRLVRHSRFGESGVGGELRWGYDLAGRRTSMTDAFGRNTRYEYDTSGQLVRVEHPELGTVELAYDRVGQLTTAVTTAPDGQTTHQAWEWADGNVTGHNIAGGAGTGSTAIERDPDGRIVAITRDGVTTAYNYDQAEQLTEAITAGTAQSWTFDLNGRITRRTTGDTAETYGYDPAGQLTTVNHGNGSTTAHDYDQVGRRTSTVGPDGSIRSYAWSASGRLAGITDAGAEGQADRVSLHVDALGQLAQLGDGSLWWDTAATMPSLVGVGDVSVLPLGYVAGAGGQWANPGWRGMRADSVDPWQTTSAIALPGGLGLTASGSLMLAQGSGLGALEWLDERVYDPSTLGFLSTDPIPPVAGAGWAANPYNYAGNNPLVFMDPTGLHPLTDAQLRAQTKGWLSQTWDATTHGLATAWHATAKWATTGWGAWVVGGAMTLAGGALMLAGEEEPLGAMLLSAGTDTLIQKAQTGTVDYREVAVVGLSGAVGDFGVAGRLGLTGAKAAVTAGAVSGTVTGAGLGAWDYYTGPGPHTLTGFAEHAGTGAAFGAVTGAASSGLTHVVGDKVQTIVKTKLHPDGDPYMPKHALGKGRHMMYPNHPGKAAAFVATRIQTGTLATVNDYADGDRSGVGLLRTGAIGSVVGAPEASYHPVHMAG